MTKLYILKIIPAIYEDGYESDNVELPHEFDMETAVATEDLRLISLLKENKAGIECTKDIVRYAIEKNKIGYAIQLLQAHTPNFPYPFEEKHSFFQQALKLPSEVRDAHPNLIRALLNAGAKVSVADFLYAIKHDDDSPWINQIFSAVVANPHFVVYDGRYSSDTALNYVIRQGNIDLAFKLIRLGADVNGTTYRGSLRPIDTAVICAQDPDSTDAAIELSHRLIQELIARGADLGKNRSNHTPVYYTANNQKYIYMEDFAAAGVDMNAACNKGGETPLMHCVRMVQVDGVRTLLEKCNADPLKVNNHGLTAQAIAQEYLQERARYYLEDRTDELKAINSLLKSAIERNALHKARHALVDLRQMLWQSLGKPIASPSEEVTGEAEHKHHSPAVK